MQSSSKAAVTNRSVPGNTVIPVLGYEDVTEAVEWLTTVFGFTVRLRIGTHRAQLYVGDGAVIVTGQQRDDASNRVGLSSHSILVSIDDVDSHYKHAQEQGAKILQPPTDYPYGERQYNVQDLGGHVWTFSQSIADINPEDWGATVIKLKNE